MPHKCMPMSRIMNTPTRVWQTRLTWTLVPTPSSTTVNRWTPVQTTSQTKNTSPGTDTNAIKYNDKRANTSIMPMVQRMCHQHTALMPSSTTANGPQHEDQRQMKNKPTPAPARCKYRTIFAALPSYQPPPSSPSLPNGRNPSAKPSFLHCKQLRNYPDGLHQGLYLIYSTPTTPQAPQANTQPPCQCHWVQQWTGAKRQHQHNTNTSTTPTVQWTCHQQPWCKWHRTHQQMQMPNRSECAMLSFFYFFFSIF